MEVKEAGEERNRGGQDDERDGGVAATWSEGDEGRRKGPKRKGAEAAEQTGERSGHKAVKLLLCVGSDPKN